MTNNINEMLGVKHLITDQSSRIIGDWLVSKGAKYLQGGNYGIVFDIPNTNYVIKLFRNDLGYLQYLNTIQTLKGKYQKYLPKIGKVIQIGYWYLCQIEKLNEIKIPAGNFVISNHCINNIDSIKCLNEYNKLCWNTNKKFADFVINITKNELLNDDIFIDINPNNIMQRPNGDFVLTDPYGTDIQNPKLFQQMLDDLFKKVENKKKVF